MSKLAYHAGHFASGSVGAIGRHNWQKRGEHDKHSNQDIDAARSADNILFIAPDRGLYQAAKERIETACTGRVTKASNWITETIVYPPDDVVERNNPQEIGRYFGDVLAWHQQEFGEANVLAAVVHMDETTPHLHTDLVPLTDDGRLSSKTVFARKELNRHHTELAAFLQERGWDIQRGESTRDKQVRAKTVPEFKKAAEAEKTALLAEIEPLREVKADIDACDIQTAPVLLRRDRVTVDAAELAQLQEQAKAHVAMSNREEAVEIREMVVTDREHAADQRDSRQDRRDRELADREHAVAAREAAVAHLQSLPQRVKQLENSVSSLYDQLGRVMQEKAALERRMGQIKLALKKFLKQTLGELNRQQSLFLQAVSDFLPDSREVNDILDDAANKTPIDKAYAELSKQDRDAAARAYEAQKAANQATRATDRGKKPPSWQR